MILAIADARFDELTDLVGIPLAVIALLLALAIDLRREAARPVQRAHVWLTVLVAVVAFAVIVVRFARLAA